ncbi:MAG: M14 family zinc carboxypeptidase [Methylococcales bacterium]
MKKSTAFLMSLVGLLSTATVYADKAGDVEFLCEQISEKLHSVAFQECQSFHFDTLNVASVLNTPLLMKEFKGTTANVPKVLFMAGIHGDEFVSVSATFKWLKILQEHHSGKFHWLFLPLTNPDGMLRKRAQRTNERGVDINRNFPPQGQGSPSFRYWEAKDRKDPRRYPGPSPVSEPETKAIMAVIDGFKPDVIVSVHAPYDLLDFDGEAFAPEKFGPLNLKLLGTYPGSLGNYAWLKLSIPVITLELPNAGIMPSKSDIHDIWEDLVYWLKTEHPKIKSAQIKSTPAS